MVGVQEEVKRKVGGWWYGMVIMSRVMKVTRSFADGTVTPPSLIAQTTKERRKSTGWVGVVQRRIVAGQWSLKLTGLGGGGAGTE